MGRSSPSAGAVDESDHLGDGLLEGRLAADERRAREAVLQIAHECISVVA
jgi:hypothetical protein